MDKSSSMMRTKRTIGNNQFNRCRKAERARRISTKTRARRMSTKTRTRRMSTKTRARRISTKTRARRMSNKTRPNWVKRAILPPWRPILKMCSINSKKSTQKNTRILIEKLEMCSIRSINQRWIMIHRNWARRFSKYWTMLLEPRKLQQKPRITRNY